MNAKGGVWSSIDSPARLLLCTPVSVKGGDAARLHR